MLRALRVSSPESGRKQKSGKDDVKRMKRHRLSYYLATRSIVLQDLVGKWGM